jgi:hypothetical protein
MLTAFFAPRRRVNRSIDKQAVRGTSKPRQPLPKLFPRLKPCSASSPPAPCSPSPARLCGGSGTCSRSIGVDRSDRSFRSSRRRSRGELTPSTDSTITRAAAAAVVPSPIIHNSTTRAALPSRLRGLHAHGPHRGGVSCFPLPLDWSSERGQILVNGRPFHLKGANWFGFETETFYPHGLWGATTMDRVFAFMRANDFNAVRVPFSAELALDPGRVVPVVDPALDGLSNIDRLAAFVDAAARYNILVRGRCVYDAFLIFVRRLQSTIINSYCLLLTDTAARSCRTCTASAPTKVSRSYGTTTSTPTPACSRPGPTSSKPCNTSGTSSPSTSRSVGYLYVCVLLLLLSSPSGS